MKLSLLIPTLEKRKNQLNILLSQINRQINELGVIDDVEVLIESDNGEMTIGAKRNKLLQAAKGQYVAFIDDDDSIAPDYLSLILKGIEAKRDCISLTGIITFDGQRPRRFVHSFIHKDYSEVGGVYFRPPNHLNTIKSEIAKRFTFPEKNFGEDTDWAMSISNASAIKSEHLIQKPIYFYKYVSKK